MRVETPVGENEVTTSRSVTTLAQDARRILAGMGGEGEAMELLHRIEGLEEEWREAPSAPIHAWLNSLRRQVERV